jgi:hypothetical protein
VQAGAGQSTTNLQEWQIFNGTVRASIDSNGNVTTSGASVISSNDLGAGASGAIYWSGRGVLYAPSTGVITLLNGAQNDFNRLQFGGTTSSFPALKRSGTTLEVRLADDSALTAISAGQSTFDGLTVGRGAGSVTDNTAVGLNALQANTTGTQNSAFGRGALFTNSTGNFNTAIGRFSLYSNTSGGGNVALGGGSLYTNTTGSDNTAGGVNALFLNLTGSNNTAFGTSSMYSNTSGLNNVAFGNGSLLSSATGSRNVAVGVESGYTATPANANTTGSNNVWIGYQSGPASTTQRTNSVAIGYQALVNADNAGVLGTAGMKWSVGGQTAPTATLYVQDATLVSGETKLTVRAGAGQTGALTEWLNAGASSVLAYVDPGGNIFGNQVLDNSNAARLGPAGVSIASNRLYGFSGTTSSGGVFDVSFSRASAGVVQVGDGANNANGTLVVSKIGVQTGTTAIAQRVYINQNGSSASNSDGAFAVGTAADGSGAGTVVRIGVDTSSTPVAWMQAASPGVGNRPIAINPGAASNLLIGTTTDDGSNKLQVTGSAKVATTSAGGAFALNFSTTNSTTPNSTMTWAGSDGFVKTIAGRNYNVANSLFEINGDNSSTSSSLLSATSCLVIFSTRNIGINTTVDSNFKLDVAASGSAGTARFYGGSGVSNSTKVVVQAGGGQSTTNLTEWQNAAGSQVAAIQSNGDFVSGNVTANTAFNVGAAGSPVRFWGGSSNDVAIRRRSDGLIGIDNNTAIGTTPGNARDIMVRGVYAAETTSDPAAGDLTIAGSNAQDTFRLYMKNDKLVVAYNRSGTVNFLTIPLDGSTTTWTQSTTAP